MKKLSFYTLTLGILLLAGAARATVNADSSANYSGGWTNGANGGGGFGAWTITTNAGNGWAGNGIWASSNADLNMGDAFGYVAKGSGAYITLDRSFTTPMATNDVFSLDFGLNYDSGTGGNKGFVLRTSDNREIVVVNQAASQIITVNGTTALTNYGTATMHWTFTQSSPTRIVVYATGRSGSEACTVIVTNSQASYLANIHFYASSITNDEYAELRQVYFDNLVLSQASGTNTFGYTVDSSCATVTGIATNASGAVVIPATLGGYPVTAVDRSAFKDRTNITSVTFASGASVTNIGPNAFQGCTSLMLAVLPSGITSIPAGLFCGCGSLVSVSISSGITNIGEMAFAGCRSLPSVALPSSLTALGESAFLNCRSLLSLNIPAGIKSVSGQLCYECRSLTSLGLPSAVTNIGYSAFYNCAGLSSFAIPSTVAVIAHDAFHGCSGLTSLTVNGALTSVEDRAFYGCARLQTFFFYGTVASLGVGVFGDCSSLYGVYFTGAVPSLGSDSGADMFAAAGDVTVYHLSTSSGWGSMFCGATAEQWKPGIVSLTTTASSFGFTGEWASGQTVRVQACTNLANPVWVNVSTNLITGGAFSFTDPDWSAYSHRYYRIVSAQ